MKNKLLLISTLLSLVGCSGSDPSYLHVSDPLPIQQVDERIYPMDLLKLDTVDVMMVIDNSGSMGTIQANIAANANQFFRAFAKQDYLKWKLGLISTDEGQPPFLGFDTPFSSELIQRYDPSSFDRTVGIFTDAVESLGTGGAASEYSFYNIERHLNDYSSGEKTFLRGTSHVFFIMVSDEIEQSMKDFGSTYESGTFLNRMRRFSGRNKKMRFYGAFDHEVFTDCDGRWFPEPWLGSPFEEVITASDGFAISACIGDFGTQLSRIAEDIISLVSLPSLLLRRRPKAETIKVYYQEAVFDPETRQLTHPTSTLLRPGVRADGGQWFYSADTNTINFYSVDFVKDLENDRFVIEFDVADGLDRDE